MLGRASPRKPRVRIEKRSASVSSLLVAWRSIASRASSRPMPQPSSATRIRERPPSSMSTRMRPASASSAFSTSSLTTDAGRSTTSPAAILFDSTSGRIRILDMAGISISRLGAASMEEVKTLGRHSNKAPAGGLIVGARCPSHQMPPPKNSEGEASRLDHSRRRMSPTPDAAPEITLRSKSSVGEAARLDFILPSGTTRTGNRGNPCYTNPDRTGLFEHVENDFDQVLAPCEQHGRSTAPLNCALSR